LWILATGEISEQQSDGKKEEKNPVRGFHDNDPG
jgi:hypothetical protein